MGKVDINTVSTPFHGKVGLVVFRRVQGRLQVAAPPVPSPKPPSDNQRAQRKLFRLALAYARSAVTDSIKGPVYARAAARLRKNAIPLAVGDYFNGPEVDDIDLEGFTGHPGGKVVILASDDVEVKGVSVIIRKSDGTILEEGPALVGSTNDQWIYTTTTTIPSGLNLIFEVTATDWAGNTGKGTKLTP